LVLSGVLALVFLSAGAGYRRADPWLIGAETAHTAGDRMPVNAPVSGTVIKADAAPHQYVKAGSVVIELDPAETRLALARAQARMTAANAHVRDVLAALAKQERVVSAGVKAAMDGVRRMPALGRQLQARGQIDDPASAVGLEQAQRQVAAAQVNLLRIAQARASAAQRIVDRDRVLLAEGAIPAQQLSVDAAVYEAAQSQAQAAGAAVREAQAYLTSSATPRRPADISGQMNGQATAARIAEAQRKAASAAADTRTAQAELAAAQKVIDRDKALLAEGAIPAQQLSMDTAGYGAVRARAEAADAALQQAQAQLRSAQAARGRIELIRRMASVREGQAMQVRGLAGQAEAGIVKAQQRAKELASAQAEVVDAAEAVRAAELELNHALIRAPVDGWVAHDVVKAGQTVRAGQLLLSIQGHTWVLASMKPNQIAGVRVGDPARVTIDASPRRVLRGRVASIGVGGSSIAQPPQDSTAAKTIQAGHLVPVQIALETADGDEPVPIGQAAAVSIDTRRPALGAEVIQHPARPRPAGAPGDAVPSVKSPAPAGGGSAQAAPSSRGERLAKIAEQERRILARLQAESSQIQAIILRSAPGWRSGPVPTLLNDVLLWPVPGEVTSGYGWRIHPIFHTLEFHTGIDIAAPRGTPILAPADGMVIFAGRMPANGMLVILAHGNGLSTTFSHLSSTEVRLGERVRRGQSIGRVGSSGWSTGPHLFFEVRESGRPVDPLGP
jgi:murein DD-endopeptidase MepM/ murein hydrolase activator NlpD/biotin carboxyl carrier protein